MSDACDQTVVKSYAERDPELVLAAKRASAFAQRGDLIMAAPTVKND
jgi:hypothetical protein